jgi:Helix-turn-helix domain
MTTDTKTESWQDRADPIVIDPAAWYTPEQLARLTPWSKPTFATWRCTGGGPKYAKIGRRILYLGADVKAFIAGHLRHSTTVADTVVPSGPFAKNGGR